MDEKIDTISAEELNAIKNVKAAAIQATNMAETAYSNARIKELEAKNLILTIYNKYSVRVGIDEITEDGVIHRNVNAIQENLTKEVEDGQ